VRKRHPASERPSLLLVDDDSMVGRMLGHAAQECGCEATWTVSMDRFYEAFVARTPDIVALDLWVPGEDGVELLRYLAEQKFAGRVLIVSGLERRIVEAAVRFGEALGLDMAEPLAKPFRIDDLARRLPALETAQ
jgi:DNA-binding response OmpR family regulator